MFRIKYCLDVAPGWMDDISRWSIHPGSTGIQRSKYNLGSNLNRVFSEENTIARSALALHLAGTSQSSNQ
jgi:hypothetical protein